MASPPSPTDQTGLLKEVLEAVKALTLNQTLLSSHVDAISGRVNVLAGMKEVRDVAETARHLHQLLLLLLQQLP